MLREIGCRDWAFGGGSALAFRLRHRVSYDCDIFLHDAQYLGYLTPRSNPIAESLADTYLESASGLKIVTPRGDIDFIVARDLTANPTIHERIAGVETPCHTNAEILAKKIEFRGFAFAHRDMYDLAVLIDREPHSVDAALASCSKTALDQALARIADELDALPRELGNFVNPTSSGRAYVKAAKDILASRFAEALKAPRSRPPRKKS